MILIMPLFFDYGRIGQGKTFIEGYEKVLKSNKIDYKYIQFKNSEYFWKEIEKANLFIARWRGIDKDLSLMQAILPEIERYGVNTLPNFNTAYHCGDKLRLAVFYEANLIKSPKSYIFWRKDDFLEWISKNNDRFPLIAKLRQGAGSQNVIMIKNNTEAIRLAKVLFSKGVRHGMLEEAAYGKFRYLTKLIINLNEDSLKILKRKIKTTLFSNLKLYENTCLILQEYLSKNNYDTRITIIGDRGFCFRRFNRNNDFRASGSGKIDYNPHSIDERMLSIAFKISKQFDFQTMAYDFIYDLDNNPSLLEMNHTYVDKFVANCPVFWKSNGCIEENKGRYPQYWQLVDILDDRSLKHF